MGDAFSVIFDMFSSITEILKDKAVFTAYGFTFSMWDFLVAFLILDVAIGLVLIVGPRPIASTFPGSSVSERNQSELEDKEATDKMVEKGFLI
ncbi:MAG: hypothetical protein ACI4C7_08190 [Clostridia bacterium]